MSSFVQIRRSIGNPINGQTFDIDLGPLLTRHEVDVIINNEVVAQVQIDFDPAGHPIVVVFEDVDLALIRERDRTDK